MSDARTDDLHQRISDLESQLDALKRELRDNQLDLWKARIDDLEVQLRLAQMDVRDDVGPVVDKLRKLVLDAQEQVTNASSSAREALQTLADGVRDATERIRSSLNEAGSALKR
jgi:hypothetical protein